MIDRVHALIYCKLRQFNNRVMQAANIVEATLKAVRKPYIAFSGGKDSTVILEIVRKQRPDIAVVYFDADCAYPETVDILNSYEERGIKITRWGCEPLLDTIRKHGIDNPNLGSITMWTTVYNPAWRLMQEFGYDCVFLGLRKQESRARRILRSTKGPIYYNKFEAIIKSNPIIDWKDEDVWAFIHSRDLPYNRAYDKGVDRISYYAGTTNIRRGRWLELKRHWPSIFNRFAAEFPEITQYV